jgi:DAK2 domain fusion protein YloV
LAEASAAYAEIAMRAKRVMEDSNRLSGRDLKEMLAGSLRRLGQGAAVLDSLNVFPVPDGDTGANMLHGMSRALEEISNARDDSVCGVAEAVARGALTGARGNSGLILSQFWLGFARGLKGKTKASTADLADAFEESAAYAFRAVSKPVEGTILTVIREIAAAASDLAEAHPEPARFLEEIVRAAEKAVKDTPRLLPVLREARVVDAGAEGLRIILLGALEAMTGVEGAPISIPMESRFPFDSGAFPHGYCIEFFLRSDGLDKEALHAAFADSGDSLVIAGDDCRVKVHIHTSDPEAVLKAARSFAEPYDLLISDMRRQYRERAGAGAEDGSESPEVVVAAAGGGFAEIFTSLGASGVVTDRGEGEPNEEELRRAVGEVSNGAIILLPTDPLSLSSALRVRDASRGRVAVVEARTLPQAIASMVSYDPSRNLSANLADMRKAAGNVISIEIRRAGGKDSMIGVRDGERQLAGQSAEDVAGRILEGVEVPQGGLATVYHGEEAAQADVSRLCARLREAFSLEVECVTCSHPVFSFVVSIE